MKLESLGKVSTDMLTTVIDSFSYRYTKIIFVITTVNQLYLNAKFLPIGLPRPAGYFYCLAR